MNQQDFDGRDTTARAITRLSYDAAIEYLATLRGREQIVRVTLSPPLRVPLVKVVGVIGEVVARPRQGAPSIQATLTIGKDCQLELSANQFKGATRLALGPEGSAIVLNLGDADVLVQDVRH